MLNNYALIIGVEDYRAYDRSSGSNLPGAVNDARAFFRQCLAMGFSPERIRVLTSPKLSPAALGPRAGAAHVAEATHEAIVAGLEWIVRELSSNEPSAGLVAFVGHGLLEQGIVLCPSDFRGAVDQLVRVSDVVGQIDHRSGVRSLTMVLDCRHAGQAGQAGAPAPTSVAGRIAALTREPEDRSYWEPEFSIAASADDGTSASSAFGGEEMGAFTWAITSVLEQCKTIERKGMVRLDATYGEIVSRTRVLLEGLSFRQVPVLRGRGDVLFPHSADDNPPQINPGQYVFQLSWFDISGIQHSQELAQVFATGTGYGITIDGAQASDNTEYWYVNEDLVPDLGSSTQNSISITRSKLVQGQAYTSPTYTHKQPFRLAEVVTWVQSQSPITPGTGQTGTFFSGTDDAGQSTWMQLVAQNGTGRGLLKGVGWFIQASSAPSTGFITPMATFSFTSSGPPSSPTYYGVTQTVPS